MSLASTHPPITPPPQPRPTHTPRPQLCWAGDRASYKYVSDQQFVEAYRASPTGQAFLKELDMPAAEEKEGHGVLATDKCVVPLPFRTHAHTCTPVDAPPPLPPPPSHHQYTCTHTTTTATFTCLFPRFACHCWGRGLTLPSPIQTCL